MSACPPHPLERMEIRRKRAVGGGSHWVRQCQECGAQVGPPIPFEKIADPKNVKLWNQRLARRANPTASKREYAARFKRPDWKKLRKLVLERDRFECRSCGEPATEVHHLTYERFGEERLTDLIACCAACNQAERERRITSHVLGSAS